MRVIPEPGDVMALPLLAAGQRVSVDRGP